ncbi:hypothetical protein GLYMA_04G049000v4 [Glycine max]|uniref:Uncharacterized protein n=1 Tax=Glycine max TaxID=3847 RepID=A0A0R0K3Z2_SOYBN|nr:hypothetical protein JHK87_008958 [Glycine soja]KAG5048242.1 hypothetical protein JHK85_009345 [Glycine max]KAH1109825.1 hypothetical protein GYH30_008964 [Glycine max]KRH61463.1 hypothetical protein GLYMA_04G049000v4 [Glycine max]
MFSSSGFLCKYIILKNSVVHDILVYILCYIIFTFIFVTKAQLIIFIRALLY